MAKIIGDDQALKTHRAYDLKLKRASSSPRLRSMGDVSDDVSIESFSFDELATSLPENRRPLNDDPSISGERTLLEIADEGIECSEETFFDDEPSARPLSSRDDAGRLLDLRDAREATEATPRRNPDAPDRGGASAVPRMTTRGAAARPPSAAAAAAAPEPRYRGVSATGQHKRAKFPTSKAPISAVFHSFWLIFGRAIISRNGLEA